MEKGLSGLQSQYLVLAMASSMFEGYLRKQPIKVVHRLYCYVRSRVLSWELPASTLSAWLGNALLRTARALADLLGITFP